MRNQKSTAVAPVGARTVDFLSLLKNVHVHGNVKCYVGIGSGDSIRIYDREGNLVDKCSWTEHASYDSDPALASIGRYPDGTGSFVIMKETKGTANEWYKPEIVINEVESDCEDVVSDWAVICS